MRSLLVILTIPFWPLPAVAVFPIQSGPEFQVNTYTIGHQSGSVACDANGNFVVVSGSIGQDGDGTGLFAQRYDSTGVPQGTEFQVNTYTIGSQSGSALFDENGNFVLAWNSEGQDGDGSGVFAQRYDSTGAPQGTEFQVSTYTSSSQVLSSVPSANGDFVVARNNGYGLLFAQRYDNSGAPQGTEFQVNTYTAAGGHSVSPDANGNFVVAWTSGSLNTGLDGSMSGVFAQRYDSTGAPQGTEFQVNTYTKGFQGFFSLSSDANGNFVVVWTSSRGVPISQDGDDDGVFAQRYDSVGDPVGTEFQVNTYTKGRQTGSSVSFDANGNFVVIWGTKSPQDGDADGVFAQWYDSTGAPQGAEFQVNTYHKGSQFGPSVCSASNGDFVANWVSREQDGDGVGIFAQRYTLLAPQCGATPLGTCKTPGRSLLLLRDATPDTRDKVLWKWLNGPMTDIAEFGDPTTTANYALCIYHGGNLLMEINAPRRGACKFRPCWKEGRSRYAYRDRAALAPNGVSAVKLLAGGTGRAKAIVKGKGGPLPDPGLSLTEPVTVELVNDQTATCFGDTYTGAEIIKSSPEKFKARAANP